MVDVSTDGVRALLHQLGEDPNRPGLLDTPRRVSNMWRELIKTDVKPPAMTTFPKDQDGVLCDNMVVVGNIDFWSLCEHHMLPFIGKCHVGYIPGDTVVGLSKFARVVEYFSRRLQVQERLTAQVAEFLMRELKPQGVCVLMTAEHLCMSMRGVRSPGHFTTTHAIRGDIDKNEFLEIVKHGRS